jgi:tRNA(adenine34) deaminase
MLGDDYFMREALKEAQKAYDAGEVPVGAVIVCQERIIARAHNLTERLNDVTAHAEMQAITSAANYLGGKYLTNCSVYITLEPCVMCAGALNWSQISRVVYGAEDQKKGFLKYSTNMLHPKTILVGGVLKQQCSELLTRFFRERRLT